MMTGVDRVCVEEDCETLRDEVPVSLP
jgi:hypothetical protein